MSSLALTMKVNCQALEETFFAYFRPENKTDPFFSRQTIVGQKLGK